MASAATLSDTTQVGSLVESKGQVSLPPGAREWVSRFDSVYQDASGDISKVPWAHRQPCPSMMAWMNAEAPSLIRCGARAAVVGCGLGEDAVALHERGYDVVAFDSSPTAIEWAKRLHPEHTEVFVHADLFDLPHRMRNRFDLVVEVHTLQALPPEYRPALTAGMASLLSPRGGILLAVCRGRDANEPLDLQAGPPYPLSVHELESLMDSVNLVPLRAVDEFLDGNEPPTRRLRGAFRRV